MQNNNKSVTIWVAITAIVLVLTGYAIFYLRPPQQAETPGMAVTAPKEDSVAAIESDLMGMSLDGLDSELADIAKEL